MSPKKKTKRFINQNYGKMSSAAELLREIHKTLEDLDDDRRANKPWLPRDTRDVTNRLVIADWSRDGHGKPSCVKHGAMHRIDPVERIYRCSECGVGARYLGDRQSIQVNGGVYWENIGEMVNHLDDNLPPSDPGSSDNVIYMNAVSAYPPQIIKLTDAGLAYFDIPKGRRDGISN